jgi:hypothetical protein
MADNMEESFLITKSWGKVRQRIKKGSRLAERVPFSAVLK